MKKRFSSAISVLLSIFTALMCVCLPAANAEKENRLMQELTAGAMSIYLDGAQAVSGQNYQLKILVKNPVAVSSITNLSLNVPNGWRSTFWRSMSAVSRLYQSCCSRVQV